jgi:hypothetical protein
MGAWLPGREPDRSRQHTKGGGAAVGVRAVLPDQRLSKKR